MELKDVKRAPLHSLPLGSLYQDTGWLLRLPRWATGLRFRHGIMVTISWAFCCGVSTNQNGPSKVSKCTYDSHMTHTTLVKQASRTVAYGVVLSRVWNSAATTKSSLVRFRPATQKKAKSWPRLSSSFSKSRISRASCLSSQKVSNSMIR